MGKKVIASIRDYETISKLMSSIWAENQLVSLDDIGDRSYLIGEDIDYNSSLALVLGYFGFSSLNDVRKFMRDTSIDKIFINPRNRYAEGDVESKVFDDSLLSTYGEIDPVLFGRTFEGQMPNSLIKRKPIVAKLISNAVLAYYSTSNRSGLWECYDFNGVSSILNNEDRCLFIKSNTKLSKLNKSIILDGNEVAIINKNMFDVHANLEEEKYNSSHYFKININAESDMRLIYSILGKVSMLGSKMVIIYNPTNDKDNESKHKALLNFCDFYGEVKS